MRDEGRSGGLTSRHTRTQMQRAALKSVYFMINSYSYQYLGIYEVRKVTQLDPNIMGKCSKDKRDVFYRLAKEEGWRARSAFKLLQIEDQFGIFHEVTRAVDLCAAPGSWSQVLAKKLQEQKRQSDNDVKIVAVDIQTMAPLEGVTILQGDITSKETAKKIIEQFRGYKAQLVVCDGAPDVTGQHDLDVFIQSQLLLAALNITTFILEKSGAFVAKLFRGTDISLMIAQFRLFFEHVQVVKPKSSRTSSTEAFIVCRNFKLPSSYKPRMFDLLLDEEDLLEETRRSCRYVPFLMCGDLNPVGGRHFNSPVDSADSDGTLYYDSEEEFHYRLGF